MDYKFKILNMGFNYRLAVEIIDMFNKSIACIEKDLGSLVCLDTISFEDMIINKILLPNCRKINKPNKYTILHTFIEYYLYYYIMHERYYLLDELCDDYQEGKWIIEFVDKIADMINEYNVDTTLYKKEIRNLFVKVNNYDDETYLDSQSDIHQEISEIFDNLIEQFDIIEKDIVNATFYILYNNKNFLFNFNNYFRKYINNRILPNDIFDENGHIKRLIYIPKWLQRGVFYRDNARCQKCGNDLSGMIGILNDGEIQFDHIIPLASNGTNDPSNFQLLCGKCNKIKSKKVNKNKYFYQMYW